MANSTLAQTGKGVTFQYQHGSPLAYSAMAPVRSINGIGVTPSEVDSTTLDSTVMEFVSGLGQGKPITIVFAAGSAIATIVEGLAAAGTTFRVQVTFPSPFSASRFFDVAAPGFEYGAITPNGLQEITLSGRISSTISSVS